MTVKLHLNLVISVVWLMWTALPISSQVTNELQIESVDGSVQLVGLDVGYGFATVPMTLLEGLGWSTTEVGDLLVLVGPEEIEIRLGHRTPFFRWNDQILQFVDTPYRIEGETYIPLQLLTDFFPKRLPTLYAFNEVNFTLQAADPSELRGDALAEVKPGDGAVSYTHLTLPTIYSV